MAFPPPTTMQLQRNLFVPVLPASQVGLSQKFPQLNDAVRGNYEHLFLRWQVEGLQVDELGI